MLPEIQVTSEPRFLSTPSDVEQFETEYWVRFPEGYREYVTQLGNGLLAKGLIRIYSPDRVQKFTDDWRKRIANYWFWDQTPERLTLPRARECFVIGDTVQGDEFIFHPQRAGQIFVLPRNDSQVFVIKPDLWSTIEWVCSSGELVAPISSWDFAPIPESTESTSDSSSPIDPTGESLIDIIDQSQRWAKRHTARKAAQKELKTHTGKGRKAVLMYEGILHEGESPWYEPGYTAAWRILDASTGLEEGVFRWSQSSDSTFSYYLPSRK